MSTTGRRLMATGILLSIGTSIPVLVQQQLDYPETRKGDAVDVYHGTRVPDPYRWMEDLDSKEVAEWIAVQNKLTFGYLETLPGRERS